MKPIKTHIRLMLLSLVLVMGINGCVEPFNFETETFESALVVEANITNELKQQEVLLTRTFRFEEDGPSAENGATVQLVDDTGTVYDFSETEGGSYLSIAPFAAAPNTAYQLRITTGSGRSYTSSFQEAPQSTQIDDVYAERIDNEQGENGMAIFVDSFDPTGTAQYYRYTYEETYKIIAPDWRPFDYVVTGDVFPDCTVGIVARSQDEEICFNTVASNKINLFNLNNLTENRVERHQVRFMPSDNFIISHRYSILVKQFVQNRDAFFYYQTLSDFAGEGSLFSQVQAGFIQGNITTEMNPDEKIIGFFEVTTVDEKRIYFNYTDFYPNDGLPPYVTNCTPYNPPIISDAVPGTCGELINRLKFGEIVYWDDGSVQDPDPNGPYLVVQTVCGKCSELGDTEMPDFWEEE